MSTSVNYLCLSFSKFCSTTFCSPFSSQDNVQNQIQNDQYGGVEEGTGTTMEVDSITTKVVIKSTQVELDTIGATTKTVHPSTCPPSQKLKRVPKTFNWGMTLKLLQWQNKQVFGRNRLILLDPKDEIRNRREDNVKAKMVFRPVLKICNFVLKIKLYQFYIIDFTLLLILCYYQF